MFYWWKILKQDQWELSEFKSIMRANTSSTNKFNYGCGVKKHRGWLSLLHFSTGAEHVLQLGERTFSYKTTWAFFWHLFERLHAGRFGFFFLDFRPTRITDMYTVIATFEVNWTTHNWTMNFLCTRVTTVLSSWLAAFITVLLWRCALLPGRRP